METLKILQNLAAPVLLLFGIITSIPSVREWMDDRISDRAAKILLWYVAVPLIVLGFAGMIYLISTV